MHALTQKKLPGNPPRRPRVHENCRQPIPQEFIEANNLHDKIKDGYIYMKIIKGIYGLPQSGKLANKLLKEILEVEDYVKVDHTPGLFKHKCRPIWFTLVVDDFGIRYVKKNT